MRNGIFTSAILALLVACGPSATRDTGPTGDTGPRTDTPGTDTGMRVDAPTSSDPCAAGMGAEALVTLGCNGGFPTTAAPAMNAIGGGCTWSMTEPQGTCMAGLICFSPGMGPMGTCLDSCVPGPTYVSRSTCAAGTRCFELAAGGTDGGLCFGDCDATHMCPTGQMCDGEGSCYFRM